MFEGVTRPPTQRTGPGWWAGPGSLAMEGLNPLWPALSPLGFFTYLFSKCEVSSRRHVEISTTVDLKIFCNHIGT